MADKFWEQDAAVDTGGEGARADGSSSEWWKADKPAEQGDLPKGVKPSTAGAGRGRVNPPMPSEPQPEPPQGDPMGTGFAEIANQPPRRESVLEGVDLPEPTVTPAAQAENDRLSRRNYAERAPTLDDPRNTAPSMRSGELAPDNPNVGRGRELADASLPVRAAVKTVTQGVQGLAGTVRAAADVAGVKPVSQFAENASRNAEAFEQGMGQSKPVEGFGPSSPVPYLKDMAEGATSSLLQSAGFAAALGPRAVIPLMTIQQSGQTYNDARAAGKSPTEALAYAVPYGAFEAIGEKYQGLDKAAEALKVLMTKGAPRAAVRSAGEALLSAGVREIPGEVITYLGQSGMDALPGIGLRQDMTVGDWLNGLRDTVVQAAMMGGTEAAGGAHAARAAGEQQQPSAEEIARAKGFLAQQDRIKQLNAAGEKEVAGTLERRLNAEMADGELAAMKGKPYADDPDFQQRYRTMRAAGVKPVEASSRAAMVTGFSQIAQQAGLTPKAIDAAVEAAGKMPLEKVSGFFERYTAKLAQSGMGRALPPGTMGGAVDAVGNDAMNTALQHHDRNAAAAQAVANMEKLLGGTKSPAADTGSVPAAPQEEPAAGTPATEQAAPDVPALDHGNDVLVTPEADAVHAAATSPLNDLPEPTQGQKNAGNYRMGRLRIGGLDISVENPQGSVRRGVDADGNPWETPLQDHYGYVRGTVGADKDHLDVFVKPGTPADYRGPVFVVDQIDPKTGRFDEHKVVIGAADQAEAEQVYRRNYDAGWNGMGAVTQLPMPAFQAWARSGKTKEPLGDLSHIQPAAEQPASAAAAPAQPTDRAGAPAADGSAGAGALGEAGNGADAAPPAAVAPDAEAQRRDFAASDKVRRERAARLRSAAFDKNPLMAFLAKHGVSLELASEFAPGPKERRSAIVSGYGPIFRRAGLNVDLLAQRAAEEGFLPPGSTDAGALYDLMARAFRGERIAPMYAEGAAEDEMRRRADDQSQPPPEEEVAAVEALADLSDNELETVADLVDDVPDLDAGSNTSLEAAMRSLGFTDQEIRDAVAQESRRQEEDRARGGGVAEAAQGAAQATAAGREGEAPAAEVGAASTPTETPAPAGVSASTTPISLTRNPSGTLAVTGDQDIIRKVLQEAGVTRVMGSRTGLLVGKTQADKAMEVLAKLAPQQDQVLTAPTEQDVLEQQEQRAAGERAVAKRRQDEETRAAADAARGDFTLTGSDRAADANPAQRDLLAAGERKTDTSFADAMRSAGLTDRVGGADADWRLVVSGLGDVLVKVDGAQDGQPRAIVVAEYMGKNLGERRATGLPAILEAINTARDGIQKGRKTLAREFAAKERGLPSAKNQASVQGKRLHAREQGAQRRGDERMPSGLTMEEARAKIRAMRGASMADAQKIVNDLTKTWKDGPKISVVATPSELPGDNPSDVRGLYTPGHIWIVAGAHRNGADLRRSIARTLAHEAVAHFGLRHMLGRDGWNTMMGNIRRAIAAGNKPLSEIQAYVRRTYANADGSYTLHPDAEADEIAARAVELAIDEAGNFKPGFGFFKAAWAKVAQFLRDLGINVAFTNQELQGMLVLSMKNMERGQRTVGGGQLAVAAAREDGPMQARAPELEDRSTDDAGQPTERELDPWQVALAPKLHTALRRWGQGKADDVQLAAAVRAELDARKAKRDAATDADRVRGADWVQERLLRARRTGELTPAQADLALWLVNQAPHLATDLGISVRQGELGTPNGVYNMVERVVTVFANKANDETAAHEILHHTERMMPPEVQEKIRGEWLRQLERGIADAKARLDAMKAAPAEAAAPAGWGAIEGEKPFDPTVPERQRQLMDMMLLAARRGDADITGALWAGQGTGGVDLKNLLPYELSQPSEFWAVNAARLVHARAQAEGDWIAKAKLWLRGLMERAKAMLKMPSDAAVLRGIQAVVDGDGSFRSRRMLSTQGATFADQTAASADEEGAPAPAAPRPLSKWRDATGRLQFAPGQALYNLIGKAADPLLSALQLKAASTPLRRALREMKNEVRKAQETAAAVAGEANKLTPAERAMVSDLVEKELAAGTVPPEHAVRLAALINDVMGKQTDELVRLGMLEKDAAEKWRGQYLPRYYESKLTRKAADAWADAVRRITGRPRLMRGISGKHLRGRGLYETIPESQLQHYEALGWEVRDPDYTPGLPSMDGTVQVWRDFTRAERDNMGEIRDAGFRFVMGYMQTQRDIALGRMFEGLAADPTISSRTATEQFTVQVPTSTVAGTGAKTYGKLAGRWVSKDTLSHLSAIEEAQSEAMQMYRKAMGIWKEGKTALNPVSHMNNVLSNLTMAHLAGISYWEGHKYVAAARDLATKADMVTEAKDAGLFGGTLSEVELMNMLPPELAKLARTQETTATKIGRTAFNVMTFYLRRPMGWAYQAEDSFFRYLIYRDARAHGMQPQDAVDYAQRFIFAYDDLPKGARRIRDFGIPFFSYTFKAAPALLHTALTHPLRMAAPSAVLWAANAVAYAIAAGDPDDDWEEKLRKYLTDAEYRRKARELEQLEMEHLPPWMKGYTSLLTPKTMRLGMDEVTKLPVFIDMSRVVPGGDLFDVSPNSGGLPIPQPITPSHPLFTTAVAMFGNKDLFFGKDIVDSNDTTGEAARKRAAWLWMQITPAITAGNYHWQRGMNALAQATGHEVRWLPEEVAPEAEATGIGRDALPVQPKYAAMQTFGLKVRPIDIDTSIAIEESLRKKMIRDIDTELRAMKRLYNKGAISDSAYDAAADLAATKKERLKEGLSVDGTPP